ncbi:MAG: hypothetical protein ACJ8GN_23375 [Longimicrobiaceae bacterium]
MPHDAGERNHAARTSKPVSLPQPFAAVVERRAGIMDAAPPPAAPASRPT